MNFKFLGQLGRALFSVAPKDEQGTTDVSPVRERAQVEPTVSVKPRWKQPRPLRSERRAKHKDLRATKTAARKDRRVQRKQKRG